MVDLIVPPIGRRAPSLSVSLAAHLERLITSGKLPPGSKLPAERELAASLSVSRSSLREAMQELESKRLVERRPGRGTVVTETTNRVKTLMNLSTTQVERENAAEVRLLIEPAIAALAAERATQANIVQMSAVLDMSDPSLSIERSLELDVEFHALLSHAAQNPLLTALLTMVTDWTLDLRRNSHTSKKSRRESIAGHRRVFEAVADGDAERAKAAMESHLDQVRVLIASSVVDESQ